MWKTMGTECKENQTDNKETGNIGLMKTGSNKKTGECS